MKMVVSGISTKAPFVVSDKDAMTVGVAPTSTLWAVWFDPKVFETVKVMVYVPGVLKQTGPGFAPLYDSGVPFWNVHSKLIGLPVELLVNVIHSPWHSWLADMEKFAVGDWPNVKKLNDNEMKKAINLIRLNLRIISTKVSKKVSI